MNNTTLLNESHATAIELLLNQIEAWTVERETWDDSEGRFEWLIRDNLLDIDMYLGMTQDDCFAGPVIYDYCDFIAWLAEFVA